MTRYIKNREMKQGAIVGCITCQIAARHFLGVNDSIAQGDGFPYIVNTDQGFAPSKHVGMKGM